MSERTILHTAPGDTLITDDEWAWIADLYDAYPDDPTVDHHIEIRQQLVARFGVEKVAEIMQWAISVREALED